MIITSISIIYEHKIIIVRVIIIIGHFGDTRSSRSNCRQTQDTSTH